MEIVHSVQYNGFSEVRVFTRDGLILCWLGIYVLSHLNQNVPCPRYPLSRRHCPWSHYNKTAWFDKSVYQAYSLFSDRYSTINPTIPQHSTNQIREEWNILYWVLDVFQKKYWLDLGLWSTENIWNTDC